MSEVFKAYSSYYNLIYKDKNYDSEAEYIISLINSYRPGSKNIVEFGSGTGKHAKIFNDKGFNVLGVEPSADMLFIAKQNENEGLRFQKDSIESFSHSDKFEVALSLFHVISYLNSNQELFNAFQNINKHLVEDGIFIFDVWYSAAVLIQKAEDRIKTIEDDTVKVIRRATAFNNYNKNSVNVQYDITILDKASNNEHIVNETHIMRYFSIPEIELLAKATGFEVIHTEEFGTKNNPSPETWGVCFILRKIN